MTEESLVETLGSFSFIFSLAKFTLPIMRKTIKED